MGSRYSNLSYIGQKSFEAGILSGKLSFLCSNGDDEYLIVMTRKNIHDYEAINERVKGFFWNTLVKNNPNAIIHQQNLINQILSTK